MPGDPRDRGGTPSRGSSRAQNPENPGVLHHAFALVRALGRARHPVGVTRLAAEAGLPKTTAHRLLEQLAEEGVVVRHDRRWALGPGVGDLAQPPYRPDLAGVAPPRMHLLTRATGATVFLFTQSSAHTLDPLSRSYGPRVAAVMSAADQRVVSEQPASAIWRALDSGGVAAEYHEAHPACDCLALPLALPSGDLAVLALAQPRDRSIESLKRPLDRTASLILADLRRLDS